MKKLSMILGLALSISSVSNAFCLKQYSRSMNRYTASFSKEASRNNFAAVSAQAATSVAKQETSRVYRQK